MEVMEVFYHLGATELKSITNFRINEPICRRVSTSALCANPQLSP
jgi:hypothetical protein